MSLFFRSIPIVAMIPIIVRLVGYGSHSVIYDHRHTYFFPVLSTFSLWPRGCKQYPEGLFFHPLTVSLKDLRC